MTTAMVTSEWLKFLRREYFETFIKDGGAAAKFCVPLDETAGSTLFAAIKKHTLDVNCLYVEINSAETRVDRIERIFFCVAQQIDWEHLAQRVLMAVCANNGYEVPDHKSGLSAQAIATRNQTDQKAVWALLLKPLTDYVFRRHELAKDFRVAMLQLCKAELSGGPERQETRRAMEDWLTGRNPNVSAVKPYLIFNRINRANARHFIESLFQWIRIAGYAGLAVAVDLRRLSVAKNPKDDLEFLFNWRSPGCL